MTLKHLLASTVMTAALVAVGCEKKPEAPAAAGDAGSSVAPTGSLVEDATAAVKETAEAAGEKAADAVDAMKEGAAELADAAKETAEAAGEKVAGAVDAMKEGAADVAKKALDSLAGEDKQILTDLQKAIADKDVSKLGDLVKKAEGLKAKYPEASKLIEEYLGKAKELLPKIPGM
jgi:methyl-accepting chemotaxis protein